MQPNLSHDQLRQHHELQNSLRDAILKREVDIQTDIVVSKSFLMLIQKVLKIVSAVLFKLFHNNFIS